MDVVLILLLVLVPMILQLMAISVYSERMARAIRRAADRPPYTTAVTIATLGPQPQAVARLLDRATRLDTSEVDALIDAGGGRIPLLMSRPAALRLVHELQQLGAGSAVEYASPVRSS